MNTINRILHGLHLIKPDLHVPDPGDLDGLSGAQVRAYFTQLDERDEREAAWRAALGNAMKDLSGALRPLAPLLPLETHEAIMQVISADFLDRSVTGPLPGADDTERWYVTAADEARQPAVNGPVLSERELADVERRSRERHAPVRPDGDPRVMTAAQRQAFLVELDAYRNELAGYLADQAALTRQLLRTVQPTLTVRYPNRSAGAHHGLLAALLATDGPLIDRVRQYERFVTGAAVDVPSVADDMLFDDLYVMF